MRIKRNVLYVGNKLAQHGFTATTIDSLSVLLKQEGYEVFTTSSAKNKYLRLLDMCWQTFRYRQNADVVLIDTYSTQNFYYALTVAKLCRIFHVPYVTLLHGGDLPSRLKNSPVKSRKLFEGAFMIVSPSRYLFDAFEEAGFANLMYIPNNLKIEDYPFSLRKNLRPKLLWVRSFAEIYNPLLAIEVLEKLTEKGVDASLCMVGPDKDGSLELCKLEASKKDLNIKFTGKLEKKDWISLSADYDIFINTTNFDNMPVSVVEAMALGLPVISTNVGGLPYLITNLENGILVPPTNVNEFVDAIYNLLEKSNLAESLSKSGRTKAEEYDWNKVKHHWHSLLTE